MVYSGNWPAARRVLRSIDCSTNDSISSDGHVVECRRSLGTFAGDRTHEDKSAGPAARIVGRYCEGWHTFAPRWKPDKYVSW